MLEQNTTLILPGIFLKYASISEQRILTFEIETLFPFYEKVVSPVFQKIRNTWEQYYQEVRGEYKKFPVDLTVTINNLLQGVIAVKQQDPPQVFIQCWYSANTMIIGVHGNAHRLDLLRKFIKKQGDSVVDTTLPVPLHIAFQGVFERSEMVFISKEEETCYILYRM